MWLNRLGKSEISAKAFCIFYLSKLRGGGNHQKPISLSIANSNRLAKVCFWYFFSSHNLPNICFQKTTGEKFHQYCNVEQALDSRDTLARTLYTKLFSWIMSRINQKCAPKSGGSNQQFHINLIEFSGFEV